MADKRAYFKLDVGYLTNPKVAAISLESTTAILLHIGSIGYAAQHLTDGEVPVPLLLRLTGATKDDADLLYASGLWEPGPQLGKAIVHDYLQHQRSSADVKGASDTAKKAAKARWNADGNADGNAECMPDAMRPASETAMPREKREREEREKDVSSELALDDDTRSDVERICEHLAEQIEARGAKRPAITARWRTEARLLMDRDQRTEEQVHACIRWLFTSSHRDALFWRTNVRSMPKLREEYDRLRELAERPTSGGGRNQEQQDLLARAMARAEERERNGDGAAAGRPEDVGSHPPVHAECRARGGRVGGRVIGDHVGAGQPCGAQHRR
jgi:hypothetical protein